MNRYYARALLYEKIETAVKGEESKEAKRIAKIKRQKRKRSKRAKDKMLEEKKHQAGKKALRSFKPETEEWLNIKGIGFEYSSVRAVWTFKQSNI